MCRLWVTQPLMAGMIVSNEPGYYEDNAFGIRIENLLHIKEAETPFKFGGQKYFDFERLTLIPLQRKMINIGVSQHAPPCCAQSQPVLPSSTHHLNSLGYGFAEHCCRLCILKR